MLAQPLQVSKEWFLLYKKSSLLTHFPVLSAAALRKRLLEKQASASAAESSDNSAVASSDNGTTSPSVNAVASTKGKITTKAALKKETPRTAEEVLLGNSGTVDETALYEATETVDDPPRKKVQLSSISSDSSCIQKKADGTAVLKFADNSEVRLPSVLLPHLISADNNLAHCSSWKLRHQSKKWRG